MGEKEVKSFRSVAKDDQILMKKSTVVLFITHDLRHICPLKIKGGKSTLSISIMTFFCFISMEKKFL